MTSISTGAPSQGTASQTIAELRYRAIKMEKVDPETLVKRKLTNAELKKMGSAEYGFFEKSFPEEINAALADVKQQRIAADDDRLQNQKDFWSGRNIEARPKIKEFGKRFARDFPQVVQVANAEQNLLFIFQYVERNNSPARYESLVEAVDMLGAEGVLELNPSVAGVGSETSIVGWELKAALKTRRGFEKILEAVRDKTIDEMSADEFARQHPVKTKQFDERAFNDMERDIATWLINHPAIPYQGCATQLAKYYYEEGITRVTPQSLQTDYENAVLEGALKAQDENVVITYGNTTAVVRLDEEDPGDVLSTATRAWLMNMDSVLYEKLLRTKESAKFNKAIKLLDAG